LNRDSVPVQIEVTGAIELQHIPMERERCWEFVSAAFMHSSQRAWQMMFERGQLAWQQSALADVTVAYMQ
jgi:hypothetical protein